MVVVIIKGVEAKQTGLFYHANFVPTEILSHFVTSFTVLFQMCDLVFKVKVFIDFHFVN